MIYKLINNAKKIMNTDSDIKQILESNSITESLRIKSAFLVFSKEGTSYRVILENCLPLNVVYDIQDKVYSKYKIDLEIL